MRGIFEGMGLTLSHVLSPKVTHLYPYEKPKLPARSRGLIQLITKSGYETPGHLLCESCLLCEKACPPRAITIEYTPMNRWKKKPYFVSYTREGAEKYTQQKIAPNTGISKASFYTPRISEYAVTYPARHIAPCVKTPVKESLEPSIDLKKLDALLTEWSTEASTVPALLERVMSIYGYLPLQAARRIVQTRGIDLSDLYGIATMSPSFVPASIHDNKNREDHVSRGLAPDKRGIWGNIHHERQPYA